MGGVDSQTVHQLECAWILIFSSYSGLNAVVEFMVCFATSLMEKQTMCVLCQPEQKFEQSIDPL